MFTNQKNFAVAWAILFVLVLPSFAVCIPDLLIDLVFINWARRNLRVDLRLVIQRQMQTMQRRVTPLPPPQKVPPVIPA